MTYAISGPPSNLALKKFGPRWVLPTILLIVSFILIGSGCANNRAQWFALRLRRWRTVMVNTSLTPSPRHLRSGNVPWVRLLSYDLVHAFSDSWADDHILHRGLGVSQTFSPAIALPRIGA